MCSKAAAILQLAEDAGVRQFTGGDLAYLNGPWIFHNRWMCDDAPAWARLGLDQARMAAVLAGSEMCSHLEAAMYLNSAWAAGPLDSKWLPITQYAVGQAMGIEALPADLRCAVLDVDERVLYDDLRRKIWQAVVKHNPERRTTKTCRMACLPQRTLLR